MNNKRILTLMLGLLVIVIATPGCGVINNLRAKNSLNDGVREFNKGRYDTAQQKFERALYFSPENANAQLFYARALNAQFDQSQTEALGLKTLEAYDNIIKHNQNNPQAVDQALAFKANVYKQLALINSDKDEEYKQARREALLQRTELSTATEKTKADVHYTLGVGYWEEAYALDSSYVTHKQPIPNEVAEKVRPLVQKAHEHLQRAVSIQPDYANAYFYEKLAYLQDYYIEQNPARKKEFETKANQQQDKYLALQKQQQQAAGAESGGSQ